MNLKQLAPGYGGQWTDDPQQMAPYLTDWRKRWRGQAMAVAFPRSTEEVAVLVSACAAQHIAVVPQGGNTSLAGAAVPAPQGPSLVISLQKMNRLRHLEPSARALVAEAGMTLLEAQRHAASVGLRLPLSLASEGSCTLGGNLATNAGGVHVLRYGNARQLCLGLEVVLASGQVLSDLSLLRKDNSAYPWRELVIGSEGTLAVITQVALALVSPPRGTAVAWLGLPTVTAAVALYQRLQAHSHNALEACELVSEPALALVLKHFGSLRRPLAQRCPWYLLVELAHPNNDDEAVALLQELLQQALEHGEIEQAVVANSLSEQQQLWALRENVSEAQSREGGNLKHDIAVGLHHIAPLIEQLLLDLETSGAGFKPVVFGHIGDGNVHFNVGLAPHMNPSTEELAVAELIHRRVHGYGGSIAAEHGVGVLRTQAVWAHKSQTERELCQAIKRSFDPTAVMNPGKKL